MSRKTLLTLFLCAAAAAPGQRPASAEPAGVPVYPNLFERCLQCHADVGGASKESYVHSPFREGDCVECHDPHVSDKPGLLWRDLGERCLACHEAILGGIGPADLHTPVMRGNCQGCHLGHASSGNALLKRSGPELCYECHEELREESGYRVLHAVFEEGACDECHAPHAAFTEAFRGGGSGGCLECHGDPEEGHGGLVTAESACLNCHVAHSSRHEGLLLPVVHPPLLEDGCGACHESSGARGPDTGESRGEVVVKCVECHAEVASAEGAEGGHSELLAGRCTACHTPHASRNPSLLQAEAENLCLSCHPGVRRQTVAESVHAPVREGDCAACHTAHSSDQEQMLKQREMDLCRSCHPDDKHKLAHPYGEEWLNRRTGKRKDIIDPRTGEILGCSSCHVPHGSPHENLLSHSGGRSLCIQCHSL